MKTQIKITGQLNGNNEILKSLSPDGKIEKLPFNNYLLNYPSITAAKACLRFAFQDLEPDGAILISSDKMRYDSSYAEIINS